MGFKPKENIGERIQQQQEAQFNREQFLEDVFNEEYILVVGSEVIMNREEEPSGDVNQYILRALNSSLNESYKSLDELINHSGQGVDAIRNLLNSEEDFSYDTRDMEPSLKALMETRLFPIILTTTFDGYLETLMRSVWGEQLRVVNIEDKRTLDDLRRALTGYRNQKRYNQPTLFYIFGKAGRDETKKYVRSDDDAIQIIEKWIQMPKEDPMLRFIRNKKLLALGCKFDDWYFRFFWYVLTGVNKSSEENAYDGRGEVAFSLDKDDKTEGKLLQFLDNLRNESLVACCQRGNANDVDVVLDSLLCSFSRGLEQRSHIHVESAVCITGGDNLCATVVTVLSKLGNHDTRLSSFLLGELGNHLLCLLELAVLLYF